MSGFQPLVYEGMIRQVGGDRTETKFLNFGPITNTPVIAETLTITQTFVRSFAPNNVNLRTIIGGEIGDLLVLYGRRVRIRTGGNILKNVARLQRETVMLVLTPGGWSPMIDP